MPKSDRMPAKKTRLFVHFTSQHHHWELTFPLRISGAKLTLPISHSQRARVIINQNLAYVIHVVVFFLLLFVQKNKHLNKKRSAENDPIKLSSSASNPRISRPFRSFGNSRRAKEAFYRDDERAAVKFRGPERERERGKNPADARKNLSNFPGATLDSHTGRGRTKVIQHPEAKADREREK